MESITELEEKRNTLMDRIREIHEENGRNDEEMTKIRTVLDEERSLKKSAIRRLAEKLCNPECSRIGPLSSKGRIMYERRIRQLKQQLEQDELEMLNKRQMAIEMYNERIQELDDTLARHNSNIRRLQVKLMSKQCELDDLRLGLEPKMDESDHVEDEESQEM